MIHYETESLGNLVNFQTGKLNSNAASPNGPYPFFTCSQDIFRTDTWAFDCECVLLGGNNANAIYPIKYFKGKFNAYQRTYVIRPQNSSSLDIKYLFYALQPKLELMKNISTGATTKFLTLSILNTINVCLPPIHTQRKIASILSAYDDLIENNTRRIKILEEMAQSIYREWFVNFHFPGHEKIRMIDSKLGKIPGEWRLAHLADICDVTPGYAFRSSTWCKIGIPVIKITNITDNNEVNIDSVDCVPTEIYTDKLSKYLSKMGDLLIAMTGATAGKIGRLRTNEVMLVNQRVAKIVAKPTYGAYVWVFLSQHEIQRRFFSLADGAAQPNMSGTQIENYELLLPSSDLIQSFEGIAADLFKLSDSLFMKNQSLRQTRDLLLPRLISGALDVSELDIDVSNNGGN